MVVFAAKDLFTINDGDAEASDSVNTGDVEWLYACEITILLIATGFDAPYFPNTMIFADAGAEEIVKFTNSNVQGDRIIK